MVGQPGVREQIIEKFRAALGPPEVAAVEAGNLYRWTLRRGAGAIAMYVSIDSPEFDDMAHVFISDSSEFQVDPVVTVTLFTLDEAEQLLDRILKQWKTYSRK